MSKKNVQITIDVDLHHQIKIRGFNFSSETEELWRQKLAIADKNPDKLNFQLLKKEFDKQTEIHQNSGLQMNNLEMQLNSIKEKQEKLEIEKLEKEREEMQKIKNCGNCYRKIDVLMLGKDKISKYSLCRYCYSDLMSMGKLANFEVKNGL